MELDMKREIELEQVEAESKKTEAEQEKAEPKKAEAEQEKAEPKKAEAEQEKAEPKKAEAAQGKEKQDETTAADNRVTGKKEIGKKAGIIGAGSVFGLLLLYLIISVFFTSHFVFRTTINGMGVSCRSVKGVQKKADRKVRDYVLTLVARDGSKYEVAGSDIDLVEEWGDIDELLKKQNGFAWPARLFSPNKLKLAGTAKYDEDKLKEVLFSMDYMDESKQTKAVNAKIAEYSEEEGYSIEPAVEGTEIDEEGLWTAVENALMGLDDQISMAEEGCYVAPEVDDKDETLVAAVEKMNKWLSTVITYDLGDKSEVLDSSVYKDWIKLSKKNKASIDKQKVTDYVAELAKKYNTCYSAKTLKTSWGETVTIKNSHYGWKIDNDAEAAQIIKDIKSGKEINRELNYSMKANSHGENDYGDSYVEINLTAQHLFLYKDGQKVMESDFVSGNVSRRNGTPSGAFTLTYKEKDAVLRGQNYASKVTYWMPFFGNYGMHDASWRNKFGGKIYKTNGSHGCVNLPKAAAEKLFEVIDKGWPVLVYELEGTESSQLESSSQKSTEKASEKSSEKSTEKTSEKSSEKKSTEKSSEKSSEKKSTEKSSEKSSEKKSTEKSSEKSSEKKSTEKSSEKSSEKKSTEKSSEKSSEKKSTEKSSEKSSEKKSTEKSSEKSSEKKSTEKSSEKKSTEKSSEKSSEKKSTEKTSE